MADPGAVDLERSVVVEDHVDIVKGDADNGSADAVVEVAEAEVAS